VAAVSRTTTVVLEAVALELVEVALAAPAMKRAWVATFLVEVAARLEAMNLSAAMPWLAAVVACQTAETQGSNGTRSR